MPLKRLTLDPALDPWERQPGESTKTHASFRAFLDLGPGRTVSAVAGMTKDDDGVRKRDSPAAGYGHLRNLASAHQWQARAQAWDKHRAQLADAVWTEEGRKSAETTHRLLNLAKGKLAHSLSNINPQDLTRAETIRLLDVIGARHAALFGSTVTVTGPSGGPVQVATSMEADAEAFAKLPLKAQAQRLIELGRNAIRRGKVLLDEEFEECSCSCDCDRCTPGAYADQGEDIDAGHPGGSTDASP